MRLMLMFNLYDSIVRISSQSDGSYLAVVGSLNQAFIGLKLIGKLMIIGNNKFSVPIMQP